MEVIDGTVEEIFRDSFKRVSLFLIISPGGEMPRFPLSQSQYGAAHKRNATRKVWYLPTIAFDQPHS